MQDFEGKVAVITGAGSGLGRALARLCASEGMKLVLADVDEPGLAKTLNMLDGAEAVITHCDVSRLDALKELAELSFQQFGKVNLLFNNAGVGAAGPVWTSTEDEWKWVLGVNLMGVVHGIQAFIPRMLEQEEEAHVVNTGSLAGLSTLPGSSVYCVSKHGVVSLSECLFHDLQTVNANIGVSVLCPAFFKTGIADSERNRPAEFTESNPDGEAYAAFVRAAIEAGRLSAEDIARATLEGVKANQFYILPHKGALRSVELRLRDILEGRLPSDPTA